MNWTAKEDVEKTTKKYFPKINKKLYFCRIKKLQTNVLHYILRCKRSKQEQREIYNF